MIELSWETILVVILGIHGVWLHCRLGKLQWEKEADMSIHRNMLGRTIAYLCHAFPKELGRELHDVAIYGKKKDRTIIPEVEPDDV